MDRSGRQKVHFYWLVVSGLILATVSTGYAAALTVNFTGTGSNVVAGYWNIGMTGGNITSSGYSVADGQTAYMYVKINAVIQPVFQKSFTIAGSAANFSVTSTEIQNLQDFAEGKSITFFVSAGAGTDEGTSAASVVDQNAPSVSNVSSDSSDAQTKIIDDVINIDVTFSESVTTSGSRQLALNAGGGAVAVYSDESASIVTFLYTVAEGQTTNNLDYSSTGDLSGTYKDVAGNPSNNILPGPGTAGSLGINHTFDIDGIKPQITTVTASTSDGYYTTGANIYVQVVFDEPVNRSGTP